MSQVSELTCEIQLDLKPLTTNIFIKSLTPELLTDYGQRATTKLIPIDDYNLKIEIQSPDITAMRATINSLLRWIAMIKEILN